MNTNLLNNIAFDIVKDKVIEDKMKEYTEAEIDKTKVTATKETEEEYPDLEDPDSEEERIFERELQKRKNMYDNMIEDTKKKQTMKNGEYREIVESEFLDTMLKNDAVVCHFYHNDFERCKIMDKHLKIISENHTDALFTRINAEKSPFFTTKLAIQVLPTVVLFKDGKAYDRVVGFEELGMKDDFATLSLTRRLVKAKIIKGLNRAEKGEIKINKNSGKDLEDEDLDY